MTEITDGIKMEYTLNVAQKNIPLSVPVINTGILIIHVTLNIKISIFIRLYKCPLNIMFVDFYLHAK